MSLKRKSIVSEFPTVTQLEQIIETESEPTDVGGEAVIRKYLDRGVGWFKELFWRLKNLGDTDIAYELGNALSLPEFSHLAPALNAASRQYWKEALNKKSDVVKDVEDYNIGDHVEIVDGDYVGHEGEVEAIDIDGNILAIRKTDMGLIDVSPVYVEKVGGKKALDDGSCGCPIRNMLEDLVMMHEYTGDDEAEVLGLLIDVFSENEISDIESVVDDYFSQI